MEGCRTVSHQRMKITYAEYIDVFMKCWDNQRSSYQTHGANTRRANRGSHLWCKWIKRRHCKDSFIDILAANKCTGIAMSTQSIIEVAQCVEI